MSSKWEYNMNTNNTNKQQKLVAREEEILKQKQNKGLQFEQNWINWWTITENKYGLFAPPASNLPFFIIPNPHFECGANTLEVN